MIRKLFKLVIVLVLIALLIVGAVVGLTLYAISDNTDEAPIDLYDTSATTDTIIAQRLAYGLDNMEEDYNLDLVFDEDSLNILLFSMVRKYQNPDYNPKSGTTSKEIYAFSIEIPSDLPLVGGKALGAKSLYGKINGENVTINITGDIAGKYKTRLFFTFSAETKEEEYVLHINELQMGKIKLINGTLSNFVLDKIKSSIDINKEVNAQLEKVNLPFKFNIDDYTLIANKQDFSDWVHGVLGSEEDGSMKSELLNVLFDPANDMLKFGMFDKLFGLRVDLDALKVEDSKTTLDERIKEEFDSELMIKSKAQTMVMSSLANPSAEKFITLTEQDFSRFIYTNTEGYKDFKIEAEILAGVNFKFAVEGIVFDISEDGKKVEISIILNINDVKTTAILAGNTIQIDDKNVQIKLANTIKIGNNINISSKFMTDMLAANFKSEDMLKYNATENALEFSADVFNTFIKDSMDSSSTPLEVSKISFDKDCLKIYVEYTDATLASTIDTVTTLINDTLGAGVTLDTTRFSESDAETVAEVQDALNDVQEALNNGTLEAEDTEALVAAVNNLSTEAQEEFFAQITNNVSDPSKLEDLYAQMFGGSGE